MALFDETGAQPNDQMYSQPLPLDHAARLASQNQDALMQQVGTDMIEELLALPKGYDIIDAQHDRWERSAPGHERWANIGKQCTEFFEGGDGQWTEAEIAALKAEGRPKVTKNKIAPLMRLLIGFFRQNRYDIKYLPGNDGTGTQDIADILNATVKQIGENSGTDWNDAQVFQDGLFTGRGFWDIRLDFARNRLGDIKEIVLDPFSGYIDPEADSYDPNGCGGHSSWKHWIYNRWMSATEIYQLYGGLPLAEIAGSMPSMPIRNDSNTRAGMRDTAPASWFGLENFMFQDFESSMRRGNSFFDHINRQRKLIRVLDCQYKVLKKVNFFVDLETGQEKIIPDDTSRDKLSRIMQYVTARNLPVRIGTDYKEVIRWTVTAGDRVLFDKWSPYDNYTVVPYFPYFRRGKTMSPIEDLIDPQKEINKRASAFLHIIMSTANSGWIWEKGALDAEMERVLEDEGARPGIHIKYEEGYEAPKRIEPVAAPMAIKRLEDDATRDIKEIAGINDSALGQIDRVQSGKAIQARQQQTVMGAEIYFDNFAHSRELKGRVLLADIQSFYTEPRLIRVRKGDGTTQDHMINMQNAAGEIENNVTLGKYDLAIDAAPISATFQAAQFEDLLELVDRGVAIPPDILIDASSAPRKEEIKQRYMEERAIQMNGQQLQAFAAKTQLGLPPMAPVPPIVTTGASPVLDLSQAPDAGAGLPPGAAAPSVARPGAPPPVAPPPGGMPAPTMPTGVPQVPPGYPQPLARRS